MSYILEALKRAEAERGRGAVPGLHARQVSSPLPHAERGVTGRVWWVGAAALVLVGLALGLWAWRTSSSDSGQIAVRTAAVAGPMVAPTLPAVPTRVMPGAVTAPPLPSPPVATTATTVPSQTQAQAGPLPTMPVPAGAAASRPVLTPDAFVAALKAASAAQRPSPATVTLAPKPDLAAPAATQSPVTPLAPIAAAPAPAPTAVAKAPPVHAGSVSVPLLAELPEDLRRQIPVLTITGVVYSENPGQRLLLVNNQVLTQGSVVAPELSLAEIQPRSSVLVFRGTRFRMAH